MRKLDTKPLRKAGKWLMIVSLLFTGCSIEPGCCAPTISCCGSLRRPPVIATERNYVLDYMPDECKAHQDSDDDFDEKESTGDFLTEIDPYEPIIKEYRASIGDILEISVFGDQDTYVENVTVAPDGMIYYLHLDGFLAEGKTIDEVREELSEKLTDLFLAPIVSVIPRFMSGQTFTILGRVNVPGSYPLDRSYTLRQAIGLAGGILKEPQYTTGGVAGGLSYTDLNRRVSSLKNSFIVRDGKKLNVNFEKLISTANQTYDILVKPGDYIYLAAEESKEIFILGAVFRPTAIPYRDDLTLIGAMTVIGGWPIGTAYSADQSRFMIVRGSLEKPCCVMVNIKKIISGEARDIYLMPGDIIYVYQKPFSCVRELVRLAVDSFVAAFVNEAASFYINKWLDCRDDE